jgi:hypothetical protein
LLWRLRGGEREWRFDLPLHAGNWAVCVCMHDSRANQFAQAMMYSSYFHIFRAMGWLLVAAMRERIGRGMYNIYIYLGRGVSA